MLTSAQIKGQEEFELFLELVFWRVRKKGQKLEITSWKLSFNGCKKLSKTKYLRHYFS